MIGLGHKFCWSEVVNLLPSQENFLCWQRRNNILIFYVLQHLSLPRCKIFFVDKLHLQIPNNESLCVLLLIILGSEERRGLFLNSCVSASARFLCRKVLPRYDSNANATKWTFASDGFSSYSDARARARASWAGLDARKASKKKSRALHFVICCHSS